MFFFGVCVFYIVVVITISSIFRGKTFKGRILEIEYPYFSENQNNDIMRLYFLITFFIYFTVSYSLESIIVRMLGGVAKEDSNEKSNEDLGKFEIDRDGDLANKLTLDETDKEY